MLLPAFRSATPGPLWILPHGGTIIVDGSARRVIADYS